MEVYSLVRGKDGLIYGGSFVAPEHGAHFFVYDPQKPWNPGDTPQNNPYDMGSLFPDIPCVYTIIPKMTVSEDGKIYGCADKDPLCDADVTPFLFRYDPEKGEIENLGQPVEGDSLMTVGSASNGKIYVGTRGGKLVEYDPSENTMEVVAARGEKTLFRRRCRVGKT